MLNYLRLSNFQKHEHFEHTFSEGLSVCVGPNWSGKSSILRGLLYGLFGASAVPVGAKNLVSRGASSALEVEVGFTVAGVRYQALRGLNKAALRREGNLLATGQTAVTNRIEELIGPAKQFLTYQVAQQGESGALLTWGTTKLAQHINAVTGIDLVDRVLEQIKIERAMVKGASDQMENVQGAIHQTQAQITQQQDLVREKAAQEQALSQVLETLHPDLQILSDQVERLRSDLAAFLSWQKREEHRVRELDEAQQSLKDARRRLEAAPEADSQPLLAEYYLLEGAAKRRLEALEQRARACASIEEGRVILKRLADTPAPEDEAPLLEAEQAARYSYQTLKTETQRLEQAVQDQTCPVCKRPLDRGPDHEDLSQQLPTCRRKLANAHEAWEKSTQRLAWVKQRNQEAGLKAQWSQYVLQAEAHLVQVEAELAALPDASPARLAEVYAAYTRMQAAQQRHMEAKLALQQAQRRLQAVPPAVPAPQEVSDSEVRDAEQAYLNKLQIYQDKNQQRASLAGELKGMQHALSLRQGDLQALTEHLQHLQSYAERDALLEDLGKYLRANRDRFMQSAWDSLLGYAGAFIRDASQQAITELRRDAKGEFTYVENGQELPLELASGMQLAILGVAVKLALAAAIGSNFDVLLLDEVSAAASDENALRLTECLASTGQQVFLITHREADAVAAQDVISLT